MNAEHDRDRALDQALKAALGRGSDAPITPACLDAETVAAWLDGGLDRQSIAMAEAHASSCARCQALIGTLARAVPVASASGTTPVRLWRWWLAPLAVGAAAATVWMVVPGERDSAPPQKSEVQVAADAAESPAPPPAPPEQARDAAAESSTRAQQAAAAARGKATTEGKLTGSVARTSPAADASFAESQRKLETLLKQDKPAERRDRAEPKVLEERVAATAAMPPPPAPSSPPSPAAAPAPVARLGAAVAGVALPSDVQITATASPSPTISWFVGRGGVVLLTTDGNTVVRLPFPETTDLTAVTASDAVTAVVTTVDGRRFRTVDGGKTWRRQ